MSEKTLHEEIKEFRTKHKLCQAGFGKGTGYSKKYIQKIEAGKKQPSKEGRLRIRQFIETATEEIVRPLRGPGVGNSPSKVRRGKKLRRDELDRVELNRATPDEIDEELHDLLKKF